MGPEQTASGRSIALTATGLADLGIVHWNLDVPQLYERVIGRSEARLSRDGALVTATGARTGRSPQDRFIVEEPSTVAVIWWGDANRAIGKDIFDGLHIRLAAYLRGRDVFVQDVFAGVWVGLLGGLPSLLAVVLP